MQGLKVTELSAFSGGMNNVVAPYLIPPDESTLLINVDIRRGSLTSLPERDRKQDLGMVYWYQFNKDIYQYGMWRSNVIWDNKWYWADGINTGKVYEDGTEEVLGLPTPTMRLTGTPVGPGVHDDELQYTYTFLNSVHGVESAPAPLTGYVKPVNENVDLTNFQDLPVGADSYRVYRIGGYLPFFMLVDEVMGDELGTTFKDDLDDSEIRGTILDTLRNGAPPKYIHNFIELNGRMFGSVENKVYYSAIGNPDSWYIYDFIIFKDEILGLAKAPGGLLVMGDTWTYLLRGADPTNFKLRVVSEVVGLRNRESINYLDTSVIWLSNHGLVLSDGYTIKQLTSDKIENVDGITATGSSVISNIYYMSFKPELYPAEDLYPADSLYPNGTKGTAGVDQGILVMDFKRGRGYSYKIVKYDDIEYISEVDGNVGITVGTWEAPAYFCDVVAYPTCLAFTPCSGFELSYLNNELFISGNDIAEIATLEYISPLLIDGTHATMKEYDRIRIFFKGVFSIKIVFDNDRIVIEELIDSTSFDKFEYVEIGIPNEDDKAYSIRYIIEGRGTIKGLQHSYKMRELN